jgi:SAM-dependent methyltransferase
VSDERYRCSFDAVADLYERARPPYADEAVAWAAQRLPFARVLDLAAGTGKLTRQLVAAGAEVIAVEPGDAMRAVLERVVPRARALAGNAEAIPLPDGSVDAVTVAQAFHWFRTEEALAEIHRVLRAGGGLALFWNDWDEGDPLLHELNELVESLRPEGTHVPHKDWRAALDASPLFTGLEERTFRHGEKLDRDRIVERVFSVSAVAAASPDERAWIEEQVRARVPAGAVDFPLITSVIAGDRV